MALAQHLAEDVAAAFTRLGEFARTGSVQIEGPVKDADGKLIASDSYTNAVKDVEIARLFLSAYKLELDRVRPPSLITLNQKAMELAVKYVPEGFAPPAKPKTVKAAPVKEPETP